MSALPVTCPTQHAAGTHVLLAHGEGARLTRRLVHDLILKTFANEYLRPLADGATLPRVDGQIVMTTDSYVVSPLFFAGGDIGKLAVHGTVNDLAVCGATPLYLSLGLILEEGLQMEVLEKILASVAEAARYCGVAVVTGDTKVVPVGAADKLFVNMTGIGRLRANLDIGVHRVKPGDQVLVSGTIGDHGIAVLAAREGLELESDLISDTAPLTDLVATLFEAGVDIHFLRDPTRGGVSAVLHELGEQANLTVLVDEQSVPLSAAVRGACELLGLDPLYVANEGKLLLVVPAADAARALACLRRHPLGQQAALIGEVLPDQPAQVLRRGSLGTVHVLDEPSGAPLPRIC